jgi:TRAP-type C4-dicarboxylate transport system substrate-binding protein
MKRLLALVLLVVALPAFAAPTVLKIGSLAPKDSPWGRILKKWIKAVKEKTGGEVELEIFWNATQGDEPAQMSKMKTGQLDGAIVSAVGLGIVDPNVNVLQVPGLYSGWEQLDKVRDVLKPRFDKTFADAGFVLVGWGDIGLDRLMSKGVALKTPADLKTSRPWVWREDPVLPPFFQAVGVVPVPSSVPEAVTELSGGHCNVMSVSALAAEQLQWSSHLDHLNLMVMAPNIGGMVLASASLKKLKAEHAAIVTDTGKLASKALTDSIRNEDATALERLKKKMEVNDPTPAELIEWRKIFADTQGRLTRGTFPPALMKEIQDLLK